MFLNTLDAQTQAVSAFIARAEFEVEFSTFNNINDPTYSNRLALKTDIKNVQTVLNEANIYLISYNISPLTYNSLLINPNGFVSTPWSNERQVPDTVQYETSLSPLVSITELVSAQNIVSQNLELVGTTLASNLQAVAAAVSLPDSEPTKAEILNAATQELAATQSLFNSLTQTQNQLSQNVVQSTPPTPIIPDTFSQNIRSFIHSVLIQKEGYDPSTDDEAHIIMRKNVLDAFYTAKTPSEKSAALDRLNRAIEAMSVSTPITHITTPFDPNAFYILSNELDAIDSELVIASDNLYAAQISGSSMQISASQVAFNNLTFQKTDLIDTMLGFRDSPGSSVAYSVGDPADYVSTRPSAPNPFGSIPYLTGNSHDAASVLIPYTVNNATTNQASQSSLQISPPSSYYDIKTGQYVDTSMVSQEDIQSGRYIVSRNINSPEIEQNKAQVAISGYQTIRSNAISLINAAKNTALQTLNTNNVVITAKVSSNNNIINAPGTNQDIINSLTIENTSLLAQQQANTNDYYSQISGYDQQIQQANDTYNSSVDTRNKQTQLAISATTLPATNNTATTLVGNYQNATNDVNTAQENFTNALNNAQQNAVMNGSPDPSNPQTWSEEDFNAVQDANGLLTSAQSNQQNISIDLASYAQNNPNATAALLAASSSPEQTQAAISQGNLVRNNNQNPPVQNQQDVGNTAIGTQQTQPTGFESINNGSPFYMQFPTLQSITDFRMKNGISPYGLQQPDEIARHAIHFNIFQVTPPVPQAELVPGTSGLIRNVVPAATKNTVGSFTIYPSNMDLNMSHQHDFENLDQGFIGQLIGGENGVLSILNGADSLMTVASSVLNSLSSGKPISIPQKMTAKLDTLERYKGTEKQVMTTEFILFTKKDFLNDVFKPLMFLTALSYPKRSLTGNIGNTIVPSLQAGNAVFNAATGKTGTVSPDTINSATQAANTINNGVSTAARIAGAGPYRFFIVKNPEYISVRHASGLFYFPLAVIQNITYEFHGPWYNYNGQPVQNNGNFGQIINAGINNGSGQSIEQIIEQFQNSGASDLNSSPSFGGGPGSLASIGATSPSDATLQQYKLPYAFPTYATCQITYKNVVPLFRDDFLQLYNGVGTSNDASSVVSVSEQQTATSNQQIPRVV